MKAQRAPSGKAFEAAFDIGMASFTFLGAKTFLNPVLGAVARLWSRVPLLSGTIRKRYLDLCRAKAELQQAISDSSITAEDFGQDRLANPHEYFGILPAFEIQKYKEVEDMLSAQERRHRQQKLKIWSGRPFPGMEQIIERLRSRQHLPHGIMLLGRSGVGKTHAVKCIASAAQCPLIQVNTAAIYDKYMGVAQERVTNFFRRAARTAVLENKPCILFFDEADSITGQRSVDATEELAHDKVQKDILNCLLVCMDGSDDFKNVVVFMASNMEKEYFDQTLQNRPGRIEDMITILPPDEDSCKAMIERRAQGSLIEGYLRRTPGFLDLMAKSAAEAQFTPDHIKIWLKKVKNNLLFPDSEVRVRLGLDERANLSVLPPVRLDELIGRWIPEHFNIVRERVKKPAEGMRSKGKQHDLEERLQQAYENGIEAGLRLAQRAPAAQSSSHVPHVTPAADPMAAGLFMEDQEDGQTVHRLHLGGTPRVAAMGGGYVSSVGCQSMRQAGWEQTGGCSSWALGFDGGRPALRGAPRNVNPDDPDGLT